jgi:hypothetical protein
MFAVTYRAEDLDVCLLDPTPDRALRDLVMAGKLCGRAPNTEFVRQPSIAPSVCNRTSKT